MEKTINLFGCFGIHRKITRRLLDSINRQLLIRFESIAHHGLAILFNPNERIRIDASGQLIPVKQGGFKLVAPQIDEFDILSKFPHLATGIILGRITRNHGFGL